MTDYTPEYLALKEILFQQKKYRETIFKINMEEKLSQCGKKQMSENVLGVLRHYFCLSFECQNLLRYKKGSEEFVLALILLFELRYHSAADKNDMYRSYHDAFLKNRLFGEPKEDFQILLKASETAFVIPKTLQSNPYAYNSLSLEMPSFLLSMMSKEFSPKCAFEVSRFLHKKPSYFYVSPDKDIEGTEKVELSSMNLYRVGKPFSISEIKEKKIYPCGYVQMKAYSQLYIPRLTPKVLMTNLESGFQMIPIAKRVMESYDSELTAVFFDSLSYRSGEDVKHIFGLEKTKTVLSSITMMKTYVSYDKFDAVIHFGRDCKIGLARKEPSVLPSLDESLIQKSKERQLCDLLENSLYVKEGGSLLFINNSLDKAETKEVISAFLSQKKNFLLIEERMIFPNETNCDGGYYAILKRRVKKT